MALNQIFIRFCKDNDIFCDIMMRLNELKKMFVQRYGMPSRSRYFLCNMIEDCLKSNDVNYMVCSVMGYSKWCLPNFYYHYPKFKNINRRWRYFVKHNIFVDIKVGDEVGIKRGFHDQNAIDLKIESFELMPELINCKINNHYYPISNIIQINGKIKGVDFYVKRKGKIYGIKS